MIRGCLILSLASSCKSREIYLKFSGIEHIQYGSPPQRCTESTLQACLIDIGLRCWWRIL
jgi:hypothetical protein